MRWQNVPPEAERPFMRRLTLFNMAGWKLVVHRFPPDGEQSTCHDHRRGFLTLGLAGSYTDVSARGVDVMRPGRFRYRPATHAHRVVPGASGCWTLVLMLPPSRTPSLGAVC